MKKAIPYLIIIVFLVGFYYLRYRRAPDLEFAELIISKPDGSKSTIASELGQHSVVHFYATWCGPCLHEMKSIRNNFDMLQNLGITFIFVTDDSEEKIQLMRAEMPEEIKFFRIPSLNDAGILTLPTSYLLSGTEVNEKYVEALDWANKSKIEKILFNK